MINRTFEPGFRIALHQKDLNLALEGARVLKLSLPSTALCQQLFSACVSHDGASWDHSALVRALEFLANHQLVEANNKDQTMILLTVKKSNQDGMSQNMTIHSF
jgi:2-hydroxy-3-oxopropionate reductase